MKTRPLFGICPLFGVSVKREFTVVISIKQYNFLYIVDLKSVIDLENVLKTKPFLPL